RAMTAAQTHDPTMDLVNHSNPCAGRFGVLYSFYIERERLARLIARLAWGADTRPLYESFSEIRSVPDGGTVLDVPSGSGVALRALEPERDLRYLAVDLDPGMLRRTARLAKANGLSQVECLRADASHLPVDDGLVDLLLCHGGLHCFAGPAEA